MALLELVREKRVPHAPGVYLMKDARDSIIYVGKAKDLYKRVSTYFTKAGVQGNWKTQALVNQIKDIDFVVTDNEIEAFLLESNLIKRYRPVYNIELKDQQRYTYLKITEEPFPRLIVARRNRNGQFLGPGGKVYGPFVRGSSKFLTVGLMRKLFKIRICIRLPKAPCLQYFIKNCDAPCIDKAIHESYMAKVNALREILEGKKGIEHFAQSMERDMRLASDAGDYERAKEIRDTLYRLDNLRVRQKMERAVSRAANEEYIGIVRDSHKGTAHVMSLCRTNGVISDRRKFEFDLVADNSLDSFIVQYYSSASVIPDTVYLSEEPESSSVLESTLERIARHRVKIAVAKDSWSADKKAIIGLIMRNLMLYTERGYSPAVIELRNVLCLGSIPQVIDCFDVSNLGSDISVGACTRFVSGRPDKSGYRRFRIMTVSNQDDFAMISELVKRRYIGKGDLPDLIVIDGGKGQLSSAVNSLLDIGVSVVGREGHHEVSLSAKRGQAVHGVECISIAKENEQIFRYGTSKPFVIPRSNDGLRLVQHIRDEAHRFGLAYNRRLRRLD